MINNKIDYKKAGALILNNNLDKCLMVYQKRSTFWGIPKGSKLDENENTYLCMLREVKEEIGLDFNYIKHDIIKKIIIHNDICIYIIKIFLDPLPICSPPFEDNNDNHEIGKIEWVKLEDGYNRKINSVTKNSFIELKKIL